MERSEIRGFLDSFHFIQATKLTRKFIEKVMPVLSSFPRKRESRTREIRGFRVALAIANLPGMTFDPCRELLNQDTRIRRINSVRGPQPSVLRRPEDFLR